MINNILKVMRWFALLIGSAVNGWFCRFLLIGVAAIIGDLTDGDGQPFELDARQYMAFFSLLLSVASIIIAWFNSKIGGLLVTVSSVILILFNVPEEIVRPEWPFYVLLFSGILLLFCVCYNRWLLKNKKN